MRKYKFQKQLLSAIPVINNDDIVKEWKIKVEYQAIDYKWMRTYSHVKDVESQSKKAEDYSKSELVDMMPGEIDNYFFHKHLEKHCDQIKNQKIENFDLNQLDK